MVALQGKGFAPRDYTETIGTGGDEMGKQDTLPRLSRIDFFRSREEDLACAIARAIAAHTSEYPETKADQWTPCRDDLVQRDHRCTEWRFHAILLQPAGDHGIQELTSLLDSLALTDAAKMLRDAAAIYQRIAKGSWLLTRGMSYSEASKSSKSSSVRS